MIIYLLRKAAKHCKKKRHNTLYRTIKEKMRKHKEHFAQLELQLDNAHTEIDSRLVESHSRERCGSTTIIYEHIKLRSQA